MYVSEYGYKVLMNSDYSVKVIDLGIDTIVSTSFTEDMTSGYQQELDYVRMLLNKSDSTQEFMKRRVEFVGFNHQFKTLANAEVTILTNRILATLEGDRKVIIADGNSWRLDKLVLPIVFSYGNSIGKA